MTNQFRILEKLDPDNDEARNWRQACEILERGYIGEYEALFSYFSNGISEETCREVKDILEMFRALNKAAPTETAATDQGNIMFQGFDGNNENDHYSYAKFLIETQGRWAESKLADLNSHWPTLSQYRTMLQRWNEYENKWNLTADDVKNITRDA